MTSELAHVAVSSLARAAATQGIPPSLIHDVKLALHYLAREGRLYVHLTESLNRDECWVRTELERLQLRSPQYSLEEARIHSRLLAINAERRRQAIQHAERERALQAHLAAALATLTPLLDDDG